jgi:hypothetical protein
MILADREREKSKCSFNRFAIIFSEKFQMLCFPAKVRFAIRNHQAGKDVLVKKKQQKQPRFPL